MVITKYYCDKCKEEGNIWEGYECINPLRTTEILHIDKHDGKEFIIKQMVSLCKNCENKYIKLLKEMNNKWDSFNDENNSINNLTINVSCNLIGKEDVERTIRELESQLNNLKIGLSI